MKNLGGGGLLKYRFEKFGGIVASEAPPFLAFVDRQFMRELGVGESPLWEGEEVVGLLRAPTEVHMAITNTCPVGCAHCYMNAGEPDADELDTEGIKAALKALAEFGVFHVALGGGEALARPDLFEVAAYAREVGLVPNLTVSGVLLTPELAAKMTAFGQVNVSVDGVGEKYAVYRGKDLFAQADCAIDMLLAAGVPTGINCVLGRENFDSIRELFSYAVEKGVNEIEFLRHKPAGRGAQSHEVQRMTFEQHVALTPLLAQLSKEHGISAKIDCSFIPMLCWHNPPVEYLEGTATYGCEAGNVLLGARSDGQVSGCSFLRHEGLSVFDLPDVWETDPYLQRLRSWPERAPEPCCSCPYLQVCRGGCRAVAEFLTGDPDAPDPDCPRVVQFNQNQD